eukprot:8374853-Alexandrium_andersonii.AAC.1
MDPRAHLWERLQALVLDYGGGVAARWVPGHAGAEGVQLGRIAEADARGIDLAHRLAKAGSSLHPSCAQQVREWHKACAQVHRIGKW